MLERCVKMSMDLIILLPVLTGFGLLYWADQLSEEYAVLRLMFQLMFLPLMWIGIHLAIVDIQLVYASNTELIKTLSELVSYLGWVFFIIGGFILYRLLMGVKDFMLKKKQEKEQDMYE